MVAAVQMVYLPHHVVCDLRGKANQIEVVSQNLALKHFHLVVLKTNFFQVESHVELSLFDFLLNLVLYISQLHFV